MPPWDPDRYLLFTDERGRPFADLLARIGARSPRSVVDLGCGAGNLTGLLADRWPGASVQGVDSSPQMIDAARALRQSVAYSVSDLRDWRPDAPVDVLVSNAALQWVPDHLALLPRLLDQVAPGGWFGFGVPGNFGEPSHTSREALQAEPPYADHVTASALRVTHNPADYYDALARPGVTVDTWETTYTHVLTGPDPVFAWISGTSLRPTLQSLPEELRAVFETELKKRLADAYPTRADGTVLMPFRRIFVVAEVGR